MFGAVMKQKISELLDDELTDDSSHRVLRDIAEDRELRGVWERYHLISSAIRKELNIVVHPGLADRIAATIDAETVVPMRRRLTDIATPRVAKFAAGLAIAASVAAVAIVSLQPVKSGAPAGQLAERSAASASLTSAQATKPERAAYRNALNAFLVEHSEFTPVAGMNGMMSYVRVVGYSNDKSAR